MKTYFRNETIVLKTAKTEAFFEIESGHIKNLQSGQIYNPKDCVLLAEIITASPITGDYIALDLVKGNWILQKDMTDKHLKQLAQMYQSARNHAELLTIKAEITRLSRYFYFEAQNNKTVSFYLTYSHQELAIYLNMSAKELSANLNVLKHRQIISKHNRLFNILDLKALEQWAYQK